MALVTLNYDINVGAQSAAQLLARVAALQVDRGELAILGMGTLSDQTVVTASNVLRRTIVLETTAQGDQDFPSEEALEAATVNLYRATLNILTPATVIAQPPVIEEQTPLSVPNLVVWNRPDIGVVALADGTLVSWTSEGTGSFTPNVASDAVLNEIDSDWNGFPSIVTGAGFLTSSQLASFWKFLHDGTGSTMIFVIRPTAGVGPLLAATTDGGAANSGIQVGVSGGAWGWTVSRGAAPTTIQSVIGGSFVLNQNIWLAMRFEEGRPGNEFAFNIDGVLQDSGNTAAAPSVADPFQTLNFLGDSSGPSFQGSATEMFFYSRYITDTELTQIGDYLVNRYGAF